jgi:hypothetical protein
MGSSVMFSPFTYGISFNRSNCGLYTLSCQQTREDAVSVNDKRHPVWMIHSNGLSPHRICIEYGCIAIGEILIMDFEST